MALKRFDDKVVQGEKMCFVDNGRVSAGSKTQKHSVIVRYDHRLAGFVKFFAQWRQYVFFPLHSFLNHECLREIADFCVEVTLAHREKREPFPASVEKPVVEDDTSCVAPI